MSPTIPRYRIHRQLSGQVHPKSGNRHWTYQCSTTCLFFFPQVNWLYRLQISLFTQLLSFSGLARCLPTICEKSWQRTSNSDSRQKKDVLKDKLFANYFMLAVFISLIKFSKIVFAVWNFVLSLKFYYQKNFVRRACFQNQLNRTFLLYIE